jgi:alpha-D-ribose 1-methylphosphonate 5-triphosphate diphosphatase
MNIPKISDAIATQGDKEMTETLILANASVILPNAVVRGAVTLAYGKIQSITDGGDVPAGAIDFGGDYLAPGLIELHTDNLERHIEPRPEVDWPHLPALIAHDAELASTGITTVFDAMRVGSIHSGKGRYIDYARKLADELLSARAQGLFKISHFLHLRAEICSETLLEELSRFSPDDRVGIVSLMDHTPGQRQFRDLSALRTYVAKKRGMNDQEFLEHVENLKGLQAKFGEVHEKGAIAEAKRLGAVLASHDDTTTDHVDTSAGNGVGFAEFPTTVEAAEACRKHGIAAMMGAPNLIRGGSHSGNVSAADLAKRDLLDIVSSDYVPAALLMSVFVLADIWNDLPKAMATVTANPAKAVGLSDRGVIEVGKRADVIRIRQTSGAAILRGVWSQGQRVS